MGVYGSITGSSSQVFAISVRNMLTSLWITESLSKPKVDNIYIVLLLANSNEEVIRLDVSV